MANDIRNVYKVRREDKDGNVIYTETSADQVVTDAERRFMSDEEKQKLKGLYNVSVKESATNGNLSVDGEELEVYAHPSVPECGTFTKVTTDEDGHVTGGSSPTFNIDFIGEYATGSIKEINGETDKDLSLVINKSKTADKLSNERNISIKGIAKAEDKIDGSRDIELELSLPGSNTKVVKSTYKNSAEFNKQVYSEEPYDPDNAQININSVSGTKDGVMITLHGPNGEPCYLNIDVDNKKALIGNVNSSTGTVSWERSISFDDAKPEIAKKLMLYDSDGNEVNAVSLCDVNLESYKAMYLIGTEEENPTKFKLIPMGSFVITKAEEAVHAENADFADVAETANSATNATNAINADISNKVKISTTEYAIGTLADADYEGKSSLKLSPNSAGYSLLSDDAKKLAVDYAMEAKHTETCSVAEEAALTHGLQSENANVYVRLDIDSPTLDGYSGIVIDTDSPNYPDLSTKSKKVAVDYSLLAKRATSANTLVDNRITINLINGPICLNKLTGDSEIAIANVRQHLISAGCDYSDIHHYELYMSATESESPDGMILGFTNTNWIENFSIGSGSAMPMLTYYDIFINKLINPSASWGNPGFDGTYFEYNINLYCADGKLSIIPSAQYAIPYTLTATEKITHAPILISDINIDSYDCEQSIYITKLVAVKN